MRQQWIAWSFSSSWWIEASAVVDENHAPSKIQGFKLRLLLLLLPDTCLGAGRRNSNCRRGERRKKEREEPSDDCDASCKSARLTHSQVIEGVSALMQLDPSAWLWSSYFLLRLWLLRFPPWSREHTENADALFYSRWTHRLRCSPWLHHLLILDRDAFKDVVVALVVLIHDGYSCSFVVSYEWLWLECCCCENKSWEEKQRWKCAHESSWRQNRSPKKWRWLSLDTRRY